MSDYSGIRGFNYYSGIRIPEEQQRKEFGYAAKIGLNSARIWLHPEDYEADPVSFIRELGRFLKVGEEFGVSVMPILFDGNLLDPAMIEPDRFEKQDAYVKDVVGTFAGNPNVIMWDIMNEPACNDYLLKSEGEERKGRWEKMLFFLRHHSEMIRREFPDETITIGHMLITDQTDNLELVDVISFHDYSPTRAKIDESYQKAIELSKLSGKPFINSETCCLCRANPYDAALEKAFEYHTGWYLFELMINGYWGDIHGIFYSDGTVRDPSIVAAAMGIFRKRDADVVKVTPDKEAHAREAIGLVKEALTDSMEAFLFRRKPIEEVLEAAEYCANLLEACELVPMNDPPTAKIMRIRRSKDADAARELAFELAETLRKTCLIL